MQLVAMGAQDVFLTGNPQITFFKVVYRRHTNFSKECIKQEFNGSVPSTSGSSGDVTCTLARNGDLVQEIYVKATIDATDPTTAPINVPASIGSAANEIILNNVTLNVGDKVTFTNTIKIEKYKTDPNDATNVIVDSTKTIIDSDEDYFIKSKTANGIELEQTIIIDDVVTKRPVTFSVTVQTATADGHSVMTVPAGTQLKVESEAIDKDITNLVNTVEVEIGGQKIDKHYAAWFDIYNELFESKHSYRRMLTRGAPGNDKIVYIPLRFWFNRNAGLALPLIALQYHEVKVLVNLNVPTNSTLKDANLLVNYVYLDTDERRRFAQVSHEYLIEQVQHTGVESISAGTGGQTTGRVDMNFNHPVKALFWVTNGSNFLDKVKIQLNGHDRFSEQDADYFHLVQPYECGLGNGNSLDLSTRVWGSVEMCNEKHSVGMYSFCLKPGEHQPSGSCNFSRIDNARLNYTNGKDDADSLHLFALNYNVLRIMSGMGGLTYSN